MWRTKKLSRGGGGERKDAAVRFFAFYSFENIVLNEYDHFTAAPT